MNSFTLLELLRGEPQSTAVIVPDGPSATYGSLIRQVERVAGEMAAVGVKPGDRVAIAVPNGLETIVAFLSAATIGTAAPLNPNYKKEEFRFYMDDTAARALIVPRGGGEEARAAAHEAGIPVAEIQIEGDGEVHLAGASARKVPCRAAQDVALILHTSGTTSRPKRVPLMHKNLAASAQHVSETYQLSPSDVALCVMPLFHVHGLVASLLSTFYTGGTVVAPAGGFNALSFWPAAARHRATWYSAVPTMHQLLLARAKGEKRPPGAETLRFIRSCSSALAPATMAEMESRFGAPVLEAYGMTEAAHQMASNPLPPAERRPGTVGRGTGVGIAILDDKGNALEAGAAGEVSIQGDNVIRGYENNPEANAASFTNGWFRTGDQGVLSSDGYLTLVGRIKELIVRGGEKISPREIDELLALHPAVAEVVCFGMPHKMYGEEVAAAVVLRSPATEAELIAYCKDRLAEFKIPKKIHLVEKIPRTATGKVQRRLVAAEMVKA